MTRGWWQLVQNFSLRSCIALLEPERRRKAGQQHLDLPVAVSWRGLASRQLGGLPFHGLAG